MARFYMGIAGLSVEMNGTSPSLIPFCEPYAIPTPPSADIVATCTAAQIAAEQKAGGDVTAENAESLCLYRSIAEQLPRFDACVFHGAAISYGEKAYLFTAPSGTGKSTHIKLWRKHLGSAVDIVNGDKPVLRLTENEVNVCSTPWAGKERWHKNRIVPLGGLCVIKRGTADRIRRATPAELVETLLSQVYLPHDPTALQRTLDLVDAISRRVPLFVLECTVSEDAVRAAFPAMTGLPYPEKGQSPKPTIEEILKKQGLYVCTTSGVSMRPLFRHRQDTVILRPATGRLKKYDVPLYRRGNDYVLHRVVKVLPDSYVICGDNCEQLEHGITDDQIVGVLTEFYRGERHVSVTNPLYRAYARLWCGSFPLRMLWRRTRRVAARLFRKIFPKKQG